MLCAQMCVIVRGLVCVLPGAAFHSYKSLCKPTFTTVSESNTWLRFVSVLCPGQPPHCFALQGFRRDHLCSFFYCNLFLSFFSASLFLLSCVCSLPSQFFPPSQRPPGCSLSKPIVSMHITNKLCSSKGYETHFCSATHCHSIKSCYHDMPL